MGLKLIGEVALDGSGFERGLTRMAGSVKGFIASAFGFYGVEQALRKTFETASELVDASQRLGIGVEKLQVFKQAAKDAGSSLDAMVKGFEKIELARNKALKGGAGSEDALAAFAKLGVSRSQLEKTNREDLFTGPISKAVRSMNQADLAAPMKEIFAKGFGQLIPVLQTDFESLGGTMKKLGAIMSTETAASLDIIGDQFSILGQILATQLGPIILQVVEALMKMWATLSTLAAGGVEAGRSTAATAGTVLGYLSAGDFAGAKKAFKDSDILKDIGDTMAETFEPQKEQIDAMKALWANAANRLKNPPKATFDVADESKAPKVKIAKDGGGDALTRVGNFLGSSRDVLQNLAQQQVTLLQKIASNTDPRALGVDQGYDSYFP